jgi:hypothetical protein
MHIEILVEDSSGGRLMAHLLPKILGPHAQPHTWRIHDYKGIGRIPKKMTGKVDAAKQTLLENLPKALAGYGSTPGYDAVFVLLDTDDRDIQRFEKELNAMLNACAGAPPTVFGLATEEVEAWYLGDRNALAQAYPKAKAQVLKSYVQDSVCGTWELLADALVKGGRASLKSAGWTQAGTLKHEWAETIGPLMNIDENQSPSFCKSRDGLLSLVS